MRKRERERGEGKMPSNRIVKMFSIDLNLFLSILILLGKISTPSKSITIIEINSTADVIESIDNIFINTDDHIDDDDGDDGGDIGNKSANNSIGDDFDEIDPLISSRRPQQLQLSIDWKQKNSVCFSSSYFFFRMRFSNSFEMEIGVNRCESDRSSLFDLLF